MTKAKYLKSLKKAMRGDPAQTVRETVDYYDEMISDRMEDGLSEEAAVALMESAEKIVADLPANGGKRSVRRSYSGREIALLIVGFPIWLPLLICACALVIALFAAAFALIVSMAAVELALAASAAGVIVMGVRELLSGGAAASLTLIGGGLIAGGLCCLLLRPCRTLEARLVAACKSIVKKGVERL